METGTQSALLGAPHDAAQRRVQPENAERTQTISRPGLRSFGVLRLLSGPASPVARAARVTARAG